MTKYDRAARRAAMKKKFKEIKKEHKEFKNMSLPQFKKYYALLLESNAPQKAIKDKEVDDIVDEMLIDDLEELDEQKDSSS